MRKKFFFFFFSGPVFVFFFSILFIHLFFSLPLSLSPFLSLSPCRFPLLFVYLFVYSVSSDPTPPFVTPPPQFSLLSCVLLPPTHIFFPYPFPPPPPTHSLPTRPPRLNSHGPPRGKRLLLWGKVAESGARRERGERREIVCV